VLNFPSPEKILLLAVIALVVLGPTRLPGAARTVGKWIGELRKLTARFKEEINGSLGEEKDAITSTLGQLRSEVGGWRNEMMDLSRQVTDTVAPLASAAKPATWASASNGAIQDVSYPSVPSAESVSKGPAAAGLPPLPPTPDDPSLN
jgi:sec-independent protein translocase protein TatB